MIHQDKTLEEQDDFWKDTLPLVGKNAVITGSSRGLGKEIAKHLLYAGANITICAKNKENLEETEAQLSILSDRLSYSPDIHSHTVDISNKFSVLNLYSNCIDDMGNIDILVNNAGIQGAIGKLEETDLDEWINTINVNLIGTVMMCEAFIPHMKKNRYGKIINISGGGATSPRPYFSAYATSKAGVVHFSETIARELIGTGIEVNCVAPGALNTDMLDEVLCAGRDKVGNEQYEKALLQRDSGGDSIEDAANLCVFLASYMSDGITGKLISAKWDKWAIFPDYLEDLNKSDIYTLRRILPEDRGIYNL